MLRTAVIIVVAACSSSPPKQVAPPPPPPVPVDAAVYRAPPPVDAPAPRLRPVDAAPPPPPPTCPVVNPKGCPAAEPNVNRPCDVKGVECVYDTRCCHQITYVCAKNKHFEAHIQSCP